ncbi:MAG: hypothetical protein DMG32_16760 [Acidobacteria bacterium]|nr:MAG: hypothetical protein DMG32_16760 [Acidobacteriota bacterium]
MKSLRIFPQTAGGLSIFLSLMSVCWLASVLTPLKAVLYVTTGLSLFVLPGLLLALALFGRQSYRCPEWLIYGAVLGIGLSGYTAITIGYLMRWSPGPILLGILTLTGACALLAGAFWNRPLLPTPRRWESWEYVLLASMVVVLTAFVAVPFLNVGRLTPMGYGYTWLFGYDFLVRGEYITAMTTGFPPHSLPLAGEPLHMYLVGYALPAFVYSLSHKAVPLHAVLQLSTLALSILFYSSLFCFLRVFLPQRRVLISTLFVCMFSYSNYWTVSLLKYALLRPGQALGFQKVGQELAKYGYVSHLFTPLVLIESPAMLALSLLLLLLFASELAKWEMRRYSLALCFGIILGIMFGIDASISLGLMLWLGVFYGGRLLRDPSHRRDRFWLLVAAVLSCGAVCFSFFSMGMYQFKSAQELQFSPYSWFFKFAPLYLALEFGPLLLLGLWGFALRWRRDHSDFPMALVVLAVIALLQVAFVQMAVLPRIRMAVRILPLVLLVGVGYLFQHLYEDTGHRRRLYVSWGIVVLALPTFFTDVYFTSNVKDVNETHYVRIADRQACDWIQKRLADTAVIQGEPQYLGYVGGYTGYRGYNGRQELFTSLIADFAQRPQALGWPYIASELVPHGEQIVKQRMEDLQAMLSATQTETILAVARKYGVTHIYVGPYEQSLHPGLLSTLAGAPQRFQEVYSANGVHIFFVVEGSQRELAKMPQG